MSDNSKTTLFIGNGYDVAYGYKTSYAEFLSSPNFDYQIHNGNKLCAFIRQQKEQNNWVDIEVCLYEYCKTIETDNEIDVTNFRRDFDYLCLEIKNYLKTANDGINNTKLDQLQREWCAKYPSMNVISLNYTPMLQNKLQGFGFKEPIQNVHGTISYDFNDISNSIVLGIDGTMKVPESCSFLYKAANNNINIRGVKQNIDLSNNYILYGCSLGVTDNWYFKNIFTRKNIEVTVYYLGQNNRNKILNRIIEMSDNNLADFKSDNNLYLIDVATL